MENFGVWCGSEALLGENVREIDRTMVEIAGVLWGFREVRCRVWIWETAG
jgi:hypothetical protein